MLNELDGVMVHVPAELSVKGPSTERSHVVLPDTAGEIAKEEPDDEIRYLIITMPEPPFPPGPLFILESK